MTSEKKMKKRKKENGARIDAMSILLYPPVHCNKYDVV